MRAVKTLLAAVGVWAALCCPLLSASADGYLSRSVKDVPPLATIDSGATPAVSVRSAPALAADETLPAAYRSDNYGYITPAKSQKDTSACWAFSAIACAEADAIKNLGFSKDTDFSEWALAYFLFYGGTDPLGLLAGDWMEVKPNYMMTSSNLFLTAQSLSNWKGIHEEALAPLSQVMSNHEAGLPPELCYNDVLHLENAPMLANTTAADRVEVKKAIKAHGAVSSGLFYNDTFYNTTTAAYYNGDIVDANHAVTLIGWDDNYSRTNFLSAHRPAQNGAWLVKNSWGPEFGQNGLFWVSYEDVSMCAEEVTVLDFAPADRYDHNYQYDGTPGFATLNYANGSATIGATYTAADNELLKAGSLLHYANGKTAYTLDVYKNPTAKNPSSGTKVATVSGSFATSGLFTVPLPTPVELQKGDRFSLVFTLSCPAGLQVTMALPNENLMTDGSLIAHNTATTGQGFYMKKGAWHDLYTDFGASPRLHAYTVLKARPSTTNTTVKTTIPTTETTAFEPTATGSGLWGDANDDGAVNMKDVLVLRKYVAGLAVTLNFQNADVVTDTALNMKDVLTLRKFLAGLPV